MNKVISVLIISVVMESASERLESEPGERVSIMIGGVPVTIPDFSLASPAVKRPRGLSTSGPTVTSSRTTTTVTTSRATRSRSPGRKSRVTPTGRQRKVTPRGQKSRLTTPSGRQSRVTPAKCGGDSLEECVDKCTALDNIYEFSDCVVNCSEACQ